AEPYPRRRSHRQPPLSVRLADDQLGAVLPARRRCPPRARDERAAAGPGRAGHRVRRHSAARPRESARRREPPAPDPRRAAAAGRHRLRSLRPTTTPAEADRRLTLLEEAAALGREAGRPPTADVPLLAEALAAAGPEGAALEPRRLAELGQVIGVARQVRTWLRRDAARFPALGALAEALPAAAEVEAALACT